MLDSFDPTPSASVSVEGAIRSGEKSTRMRIGEERGRRACTRRRRAGMGLKKQEKKKTEERGMVNPK